MNLNDTLLGTDGKLIDSDQHFYFLIASVETVMNLYRYREQVPDEVYFISVRISETGTSSRLGPEWNCLILIILYV